MAKTNWLMYKVAGHSERRQEEEGTSGKTPSKMIPVLNLALFADPVHAVINICFA